MSSASSPRAVTTRGVRDEHALLRPARAGHERRAGGLRAQGESRAGRSVIVVGYDRGIAFVAENPSRALHKVSESTTASPSRPSGATTSSESLRVAGIRYADLRGYSYDRTDVTARALANTYAQTLGAVFTQESRPFEIEIVVAEVGADADSDQIFRLTYDGSVADEQGFVAMGGASATRPRNGLGTGWRPGMTLSEVLRLAVDVLGAVRTASAGHWTRPSSRWPCSTATVRAALVPAHRRSLLTRLLGEPRETTDAPAASWPRERLRHR